VVVPLLVMMSILVGATWSTMAVLSPLFVGRLNGRFVLLVMTTRSPTVNVGTRPGVGMALVVVRYGWFNCIKDSSDESTCSSQILSCFNSAINSATLSFSVMCLI
jgi:hypothetical protein